MLSDRDLRDQVNKHFNISEIRTLCFDLGIEFEDLGEKKKEGIVRELILHQKRNGKIDELIAYVLYKRPLILKSIFREVDKLEKQLETIRDSNSQLQEELGKYESRTMLHKESISTIDFLLRYWVENQGIYDSNLPSWMDPSWMESKEQTQEYIDAYNLLIGLAQALGLDTSYFQPLPK